LPRPWSSRLHLAAHLPRRGFASRASRGPHPGHIGTMRALTQARWRLRTGDLAAGVAGAGTKGPWPPACAGMSASVMLLCRAGGSPVGRRSCPGNVAWSRCCDTRNRKGEATVSTNFDLNRRASPRPYRRAGWRSAIPTPIGASGDLPNWPSPLMEHRENGAPRPRMGDLQPLSAQHRNDPCSDKVEISPRAIHLAQVGGAVVGSGPL
jgi:hypothetical protein